MGLDSKKVSEGEVKIVDTKPIETKELVRFNRHKKSGESIIVREEEPIGYNHPKKIPEIQDNMHYGWKIPEPALC